MTNTTHRFRYTDIGLLSGVVSILTVREIPLHFIYFQINTYLSTYGCPEYPHALTK